MAKFPADQVVQYKEWGRFPDEEIERVFEVFLDGLGKNPNENKKRGSSSLLPNRVLILADRVSQAIYMAAVEGYHLNNLVLYNDKRPLQYAYEVLEEESQTELDSKFSFLRQASRILKELMELDEGYAAAPDKTEFVKAVAEKYKKILKIGGASDDETPTKPEIALPSGSSDSGILLQDNPADRLGNITASEYRRQFPREDPLSEQEKKDDEKFFADAIARYQEMLDDERIKNGELVPTEIDPEAMKEVEKQWAKLAEERQERTKDPNRGGGNQTKKGLE